MNRSLFAGGGVRGGAGRIKGWCYCVIRYMVLTYQASLD